MPFGDVLAQAKRLSLRTADGISVQTGGSWVENSALRVVGLPHLGVRMRARIVLPLLIREPGRSVLDAGCGFGIYAVTLARMGYEVTALDADESRIEGVRALGRSVSSKFEARVGDLCALPLPDASFDKVLCSDVLEHIEDDQAAVSQLARVLKPGGTLVLTVPSLGPLAHSVEEEYDHAREGYDLDELIALLKGSGLSPLDSTKYLHSRFGGWAWRFNHQLFRSKFLTAGTFYPLYFGSILMDRLAASEREGLGYVVAARRPA